MRLIAGALSLIFVFAVLVRLTPSSWGLPLYVLFVVLGIGLTFWERRRIGHRRRELERELADERRRWQEEQRKRQARQDAGDNETGAVDV